MTAIRGSLARLDRTRDELAKAWLVRVIERASLDEIKELPTERIARELPALFSDLVASLADPKGDPYDLTDQQAERAASLAALRGGNETSAGEVARDVSSLQAVMVRALREELAESDPERFADAVERLVDATGAIQATVVDELVRRRSRELESQAHTDALTGLGNLRLLQRSIGHMLELQKRYGHPFGLLLMDIDGLKRINDAHGHQAGDRLLMQVAMSLRRSIRTVDVAARLGGDEFIVLLVEADAQTGASIGQRIRNNVYAGTVSVANRLIRANVNVGIANFPDDHLYPKELMILADQRMQQDRMLRRPPAA